MSKLSQKALSLSTIAALVLPMVFSALSPVGAAGVDVTIATPSVVTGETLPVVVSFDAGVAYAEGDSVIVSWDALYNGTGIVALTSTDAGLTSATCVDSTTYSTCTIDGVGDTVAAGQTFTATIQGLVAPVQNSYAFSVVTSLSEFGAALQYVSADNVVTVTANVTPSLSFNIRTIDDAGDINVCDLGTITTATLPNTNALVDGNLVPDGAGECGYSLAVGTNAQAGFQVMIASDFVMNNATADIANLAADDAAWVAGTEAYGLSNVTAAQTGRNEVSGIYNVTITEDGLFATDTSVVPQTATNFVSYTDGIEYTSGVDATDVTTVVHGMTVGSGTPAGYYDQVVTYTVTANF